jgi:hypothetical protein
MRVIGDKLNIARAARSIQRCDGWKRFRYLNWEGHAGGTQSTIRQFDVERDTRSDRRACPVFGTSFSAT